MMQTPLTKLLHAVKEERHHHQKAMQDLLRGYCNTHNPYKIGDVFEDHMGKIRITSVGHSYNTNTLQMGLRYTGVILNKDGNPRKDGKTRFSWICNDVHGKGKELGFV